MSDFSSLNQQLHLHRSQSALTRWEVLLGAGVQQGLAHHRSLLTLAAGAFGVSVAFAGGISAPGGARAAWLLFVAWGCFLVVVASTLTALKAAQAINIEVAERIRSASEDGAEPLFDDLRRRELRLSHWLPRVAFWTFLTGCTALAAFTYANLPQGSAPLTTLPAM